MGCNAKKTNKLSPELKRLDPEVDHSFPSFWLRGTIPAFHRMGTRIVQADSGSDSRNRSRNLNLPALYAYPMTLWRRALLSRVLLSSCTTLPVCIRCVIFSLQGQSSQIFLTVFSCMFSHVLTYLITLVTGVFSFCFQQPDRYLRMQQIQTRWLRYCCHIFVALCSTYSDHRLEHEYFKSETRANVSHGTAICYTNYEQILSYRIVSSARFHVAISL